MSTDLVHIEQPQMPDSPVLFEGDSLGDLPLFIEDIELIQSTSGAEGGIPGQFRSKSTGEHIVELFTTPIYIQHKRTLWPGGKFQRGSKPICRSNDGIRPAETAIDPQATLCSTCPKGQWKTVGGQKIPPECGTTIDYTFINKLTMGVMKLQVSKGSVSEMNRKIKEMRGKVEEAQRLAAFKKKMGQKVETQNLGFDSFVLHLKSVKIVNDDGTFYALRVSLGRTPDDEAEAYRSVYEGVVSKYKAYRNSKRGKQETETMEGEYMNATSADAQDQPPTEVTAEPPIEA